MTLYLQSTYDIEPATYAVRDAFIELTEQQRIPAAEAAGARLAGAWFSNETRFSRITEWWIHTDLDSVVAARPDADLHAAIEQLAPRAEHRLLEPLGPIGPEVLEQAVAEGGGSGVYGFAILDVAPGRMDDFTQLLDGAKDMLPIIASVRDVAGRPDQVIDLWAQDPGQTEFQPSSPANESFMGPLREVAPEERLVLVRPLPYSPLQ